MAAEREACAEVAERYGDTEIRDAIRNRVRAAK
jgi:hypothetical protein